VETGPVCTGEESGYGSPDSCIPSLGGESRRRQRHGALAASDDCFRVDTYRKGSKLSAFNQFWPSPAALRSASHFYHFFTSLAEKQQRKEIRAACARPSHHGLSQPRFLCPPPSRSTPVGAGWGSCCHHVPHARVGGCDATARFRSERSRFNEPGGIAGQPGFLPKSSRGSWIKLKEKNFTKGKKKKKGGSWDYF